VVSETSLQQVQNKNLYNRIMNFRKKFYIIFIGGIIISSALLFFGQKFLTKVISNFTSGKIEGLGGLMGLRNAPVFQSGVFSDDGNYFAYTYRPEVEMPDVDGNITIRGMDFPTYFQVMETATGKRMIDDQYKTGKSDQLYVVWTEGDLAWLMETVLHKGNRLALYDMKANNFRFAFGELEKRNPSIDWKNTSRFFINISPQKGLLLEANDKRNYRIDPNTGKAETISGKLEMVNYNYADAFQVSESMSQNEYETDKINGSRESITGKNGKPVSQDDFIEVNFLTLSKNKKSPFYSDEPITYYKNHFFVLSPISSDNKIDMELTMLDKNTLQTIWKLQLPQKKLKTIIPKYGFERFYLKGDQLLVTNNDYLMTIDLQSGKTVRQNDLYQ
jgi:hypothetical protein